LHGCKTYILKNENGDIIDANSISSGLRYPSVGPEHSFLKDNNFVKYVNVKNFESKSAFNICCKYEGIIPSLESSHAISYAIKIAKIYKKFNKNIIVNLSGRGDKDLENV